MKKAHFNDQHGPICGAYGGINYMGYDWRKVTGPKLQEVTCKKCIKKLMQIGFTVAEFRQAIERAVS